MTMLRKHSVASAQGQFCLEKDLSKHAWHPHISAKQAENMLQGQAAFTYLLRKSQVNLRKYDISFIDANGIVHHDSFTLVNPKLGIFRNGNGSHLGKLDKVIRDMMHCERHKGQPLS